MAHLGRSPAARDPRFPLEDFEGLLVRHLVMPSPSDEKAVIVRWPAEEISPTPALES